jgi:hypothetical protein
LATDWPHFGAGLPQGLVKGGVAISGLYDLEPIRLSYVNNKLRMDEAEAHALSPIQHVPDRATSWRSPSAATKAPSSSASRRLRRPLARTQAARSRSSTWPA